MGYCNKHKTSYVSEDGCGYCESQKVKLSFEIDVTTLPQKTLRNLAIQVFTALAEDTIELTTILESMDETSADEFQANIRIAANDIWGK